MKRDTSGLEVKATPDSKCAPVVSPYIWRQYNKQCDGGKLASILSYLPRKMEHVPGVTKFLLFTNINQYSIFTTAGVSRKEFYRLGDFIDWGIENSCS